MADVLNLKKRAESYLAEGKLELAKECYLEAIALSPNEAQLYHKLGELFSQQQQWQKAVDAYCQAIKINPNFSWSYHKLGEALTQLGCHREAVEAYKSAIKLKPEFPWSYSKLGEVSMQLENWDEAILAYRRFTEINPNLFIAYKNLGDALMKLSSWDEALAAYQRGLEIESNSYWGNNNLGEVLIKVSRLEEAIAALQKAIEIKPNLYFAYHNLGDALSKLKRWDEAVNAYHRAIEINPNSYWSYKNLGDALEEKGEFEAAAVAYCRAIDLNPKLMEAYKKLNTSLIESGIFEKIKERLKKEVLSHGKPLELNPNYLELSYKLGVALSKLQKWEEAADACRHCLKLEPNHIDAYNLLGEALEKQELIEEAIACYEKSIVLQPPRQRQILTIPANQPIKVKFTDFHKDFSYNKPWVVRGLFEKHYNVRVSDDPDFLFYSVYGNEHEKYDCARIFTTLENRYNFLDYHRNDRRSGIRQIDFRECDFAISHYYLEDPRHYRMPLYFRRDGIKGMKNIKKPKNIEELILRKTKFCCFVYSNQNARRRINFFRKLNEYKKVDSGGKVMNNLGFLAPRGRQFIKFLSEYKFVMAFENSSTPGYTTEKIFLPMQARTIPIYWGNPWIDREFNSASFINCHDYASDEEIIARVIELDNNEELYREVLARPYLKSNKIPEGFQTQNILKFFDKIFRIKR